MIGSMAVADQSSQMTLFRRSGALSFAILIHVCAILALTRSAGIPGGTGRETTISLLPAEPSVGPTPPAEPSIRLEQPAAVTVAAPEIAVDETGHANGVKPNGNADDLHLPARLDPQAPNSVPEFPPALRQRLSAGQAYIVIVRVLVLESGSVGDAEIAASSGLSELDALALAQVRDRWRFLPATVNGKVARDWLSVEVLFRPA